MKRLRLYSLICLVSGILILSGIPVIFNFGWLTDFSEPVALNMATYGVVANSIILGFYFLVLSNLLRAPTERRYLLFCISVGMWIGSALTISLVFIPYQMNTTGISLWGITKGIFQLILYMYLPVMIWQWVLEQRKSGLLKL